MEALEDILQQDETQANELLTNGTIAENYTQQSQDSLEKTENLKYITSTLSEQQNDYTTIETQLTGLQQIGIVICALLIISMVYRYFTHWIR